MEAGRELDALIAERVFGWAHFIQVKADPTMQEGQFKIGEGEPIQTPHYSTDISAAWEVVEKMRERCCCLTIIRHPDAEDIECVMVVGWTGQGPDSHEEKKAHAKTAPHAICLAALKAMEWKK